MLLISPVTLWLQYACMPVRKMVTGTRVCRTDDDCAPAAHSHAASVCVTPSLENQTRFIRVTHPPNTHMLFVGYPPHLQYAGTYSLLCCYVHFFLDILCKKCKKSLAEVVIKLQISLFVTIKANISCIFSVKVATRWGGGMSLYL